jgi:hypothetical protein
MSPNPFWPLIRAAGTAVALAMLPGCGSGGDSAGNPGSGGAPTSSGPAASDAPAPETSGTGTTSGGASPASESPPTGGAGTPSPTRSFSTAVVLDADTPETPKIIGPPTLSIDDLGRSIAWWWDGAGSNNRFAYRLRSGLGDWSGLGFSSYPGFNNFQPVSVAVGANGRVLIATQDLTSGENVPVRVALGDTSTGIGAFVQVATLPPIADLRAGADGAGNAVLIYQAAAGISWQEFKAGAGTWGPVALLSSMPTIFAAQTCKNGETYLLLRDGAPLTSATVGLFLLTRNAEAATWSEPLRIETQANSPGHAAIVCFNGGRDIVVAWDSRSEDGEARNVRVLRGVSGLWQAVETLDTSLSAVGASPPMIAVSTDGLIGVAWADHTEMDRRVAVFSPETGWRKWRFTHFPRSLSSDNRIALFSPRAGEIVSVHKGDRFTSDFATSTFRPDTGWSDEDAWVGFSDLGEPNASYRFVPNSGGVATVVWDVGSDWVFPDHSVVFGSFLLATDIAF